MDPSLSAQIQVYESMRERLEADHRGLWALVHGGALCGTFATFHQAAEAACPLFAAGACLIRRIGVPIPPLPLRYRLRSSTVPAAAGV